MRRIEECPARILKLGERMKGRARHQHLFEEEALVVRIVRRDDSYGMGEILGRAMHPSRVCPGEREQGMETRLFLEARGGHERRSRKEKGGDHYEADVRHSPIVAYRAGFWNPATVPAILSG